MGGAKGKKKKKDGEKRSRLRQKMKMQRQQQPNGGAPGIEDQGEPIPNSRTNTEDSGQPAPSTASASKRLYHMKRNILNMLKTPHEQVVYHQCTNFDLLNEILSQPKTQPESNRQENFEGQNEPQLERITGNIVIIEDKNGVPCVIKAGNNRATPFLEKLQPATIKYAASRTVAADHIRHGAVGTRERFKSACTSTGRNTEKDATTLPSPRGNGTEKDKFNADGTLKMKGCVITHRAFVSRMKTRTHDINPLPGPAETYNTGPASTALQEFSQHLLLLTQTVEALFCAFLPQEHEKYALASNAIYDKFHGEGKRDPVDEAFGVWTSRSLVINANTNSHKDLEDVCQGWCAIVALGDFEGGDACFPELGVKIDCPPGSVIFLRSYAVEHYIGSYVGNRYSVVHFTHQTVHDAYAEMTGDLLWEFVKMPGWWQNSRANLTGNR